MLMVMFTFDDDGTGDCGPNYGLIAAEFNAGDQENNFRICYYYYIRDRFLVIRSETEEIHVIFR